MSTLTTKERNSLPSSDFALPKERKFPINDKAHARAALQMAAGARSGKPQSSEVQAEIRRRVHSRYHDIGSPSQH